MKFRSLPGLGLLLGITLLLAPAATFLAEEAPDIDIDIDIDIEARVRAQRAIERVYQGHRIDRVEPFETAVPTEVLENKVRRFLRRSHALEQQWKTAVTAEMLDRELIRMVRESRDPDRLWELFAALDNDPVLIRECLARPILVDRLVRNFYAYDRELHTEARLEADRLRQALIAGDLDAATPHSRHHVHQLSSRTRDDDSGTPPPGGNEATAMDAEAFAAWRASAPPVGEIGEVVETPEMFRIRVVLEEETDRARVATYSVPKRAADDWSAEFEAAPVRTVAGRNAPLPTRAPTDETSIGWRESPHFPAPRVDHEMVWTGSEMIVWGGRNDAGDVGTGARYDRTNDLWSPTSILDAPSNRAHHSAVWTGVGMIVWGGYEVPPGDDQEDHVEAAFYVLDDLDGDGLLSSDDCDDLKPRCTTDCTDDDGDRYCVPHDCDDTVPTCGDDCVTDLDLDGIYDCADTCLDTDGDAYGLPGGAGNSCTAPDCDETNPNCTSDCTDGDGDSYCVTHDCDDTKSETHPGATEINDGLDNHCPGDIGHGIIDEICGFSDPGNSGEFSCAQQSGATSYEIARSTCALSLTGPRDRNHYGPILS